MDDALHFFHDYSKIRPYCIKKLDLTLDSQSPTFWGERPNRSLILIVTRLKILSTKDYVLIRDKTS